MPYDHAAYMRQWRKNNPERWQEIASAGRKRWVERHPVQNREAQRVNMARAREHLIELFGSVCLYCGYSDRRALQLDHINSDGFKDRETRPRDSRALRKWCRENPELACTTYQLLCANCNRVKVYENRENPKYLGDPTVRQAIVALLDGKCSCGYHDWRALQIDHINANGPADNRTKQPRPVFLKWLQRNLKEARKHYQLLCANCNFIKARENNEVFRRLNKPSTEHVELRAERLKPIVITPAPKGHLYIYNGEIKTLREWSMQTGLNFKALQGRIETGWSIEDTLTIPMSRGQNLATRKGNVAGGKTKLLTYNGETKTTAAWAEQYGLKWQTVNERLTVHGWSLEDALTRRAVRGANQHTTRDQDARYSYRRLPCLQVRAQARGGQPSRVSL